MTDDSDLEETLKSNKRLVNFQRVMVFYACVEKLDDTVADLGPSEHQMYHTKIRPGLIKRLNGNIKEINEQASLLEMPRFDYIR